MDSNPGLIYLNKLEVWKGGSGFGLSGIRTVMEYLGNPQDQIRSIHVAGTNGKGTVSVVIASILGAAGYNVGLNVSPHLQRLNERIVINGLAIEDEFLGECALVLKQASEKTGTVLSFHEAITAISFIAFNQLKVDFMVIEVGLGGRIDASNVIKCPEVSVITSIDLDHQHILGDTKPKIAIEKAGIVKEQGRVVIGPLDSASALEVRSISDSRKSPLFAHGIHFNVRSNHDARLEAEYDTFEFSMKGQPSFIVEKKIKGRHQCDNFAVALATARLLNIDDDACRKGARGAYWPSRLEVIGWKNRIVIMDCAHNPHGIGALVDNLKAWGVNKIKVAFGVLDTKDWRSMIDMLAPLSESVSLLSPDSERALDMSQVASYLSGIGVRNSLYGRDLDKFIRNHESDSDPLLITGSIYLMGEIRTHLALETEPLWYKY